MQGRVLGSLLKFIVLLALIGGVLAYWHYYSFTTTPLQPRQSHVEIHPGDSFRTVLATLRGIGIREGDDLEWQALAMQMGVRSKLRAGEYEIAAGTSPEKLLRQFAEGRVLQYRFTIVEGWNIHELRAALARAPELKHDLADLDDAALMVKLDRMGVHPEGRFLPETYDYTRGSHDIDVLKRAAKAMDKALTEAWRKRSADNVLKTPDELLTMASIVEKETGVAAERPQIAGVFERRLKIGMRLETDPTVIYGLGSSYDGNLHERDLHTDTPYNTRTRAGLPPTPIAMPGEASLDAAANPAPGQALYFVARGDGSGRALFANSLAEHQANVAIYLRNYRQSLQSLNGQAQEALSPDATPQNSPPGNKQ
jgi:UPF0755 protein